MKSILQPRNLFRLLLSSPPTTIRGALASVSPFISLPPSLAFLAIYLIEFEFMYFSHVVCKHFCFLLFLVLHDAVVDVARRTEGPREVRAHHGKKVKAGTKEQKEETADCYMENEYSAFWKCISRLIRIWD